MRQILATVLLGWTFISLGRLEGDQFYPGVRLVTFAERAECERERMAALGAGYAVLFTCVPDDNGPTLESTNPGER